MSKYVLFSIACGIVAGYFVSPLWLVLAVGLSGSIILHELGHVVGAYLAGSPPSEMEFNLFGGGVAIDALKKPEDGRGELVAVLCGPLINLILASVGYGLYSWLGKTDVGVMCWLVGLINLTILVANVIPVWPFDGGRILRASCTLIFDDYKQATFISAIFGWVFGTALILSCFDGLGIGFDVVWLPLSFFLVIHAWDGWFYVKWEENSLQTQDRQV